MGNSNGGMHKYTDLTDEEPLYQGGFIWDFADQAIWGRDLYGNEVMYYGGDFGDRPSDYNFSGNGIVFADHSPTTKLQEVKFNYQNFVLTPSKTSVKIVNKSLFTNTNEYDLVIALAKDGKEVYTMKTSANIPAGETGEVAITLPKFGPGEYTVTASLKLKADTVWAGYGHEIAFGQYVFTCEDTAAPAQLPPIKLTKGDVSCGIKGEGFEIMFSTDKCTMTSYKYNGVEMIEELPRLNFWRAPIDNDYGCGMPFDTAQWKLASMYNKCTHYEISENGTDSVTFKFTYELATRPSATVVVCYTVTGDGTVTYSGWMQGYGNTIMIDHGFDYVTLYGHLSKTIAKKGDKVKRGSIVGLVGNTGKSTGPHLHYEVRFKGKPQNPMNFYFLDLSPEEYDRMVQMAENAGQVLD